MIWRTIARVLIVCTFISQAVRVNAQIRAVAPGDPSVGGGHIEPYTNEWSMTHRAANGAERLIGHWVDSLDVVTIDGVEYLRRIQTSFGPDGAQRNRQVHLVDRSTMAPLRSHLSSGDMIKHLDFGPEAIAGFLTTGPEVPFMSLDAEHQSPAFDFAIAGVLLVALHLEPGDTVRFPSYTLKPTGMNESGRPTGLSLVTESITVVAHAAEFVQAGTLGEQEAVRVVVPRGRRTLTFWLTDRAPYIVRLTAETPAGTTIWEVP